MKLLVGADRSESFQIGPSLKLRLECSHRLKSGIDRMAGAAQHLEAVLFVAQAMHHRRGLHQVRGQGKPIAFMLGATLEVAIKDAAPNRLNLCLEQFWQRDCEQLCGQTIALPFRTGEDAIEQDLAGIAFHKNQQA
jgi:hypothetical protein